MTLLSRLLGLVPNNRRQRILAEMMRQNHERAKSENLPKRETLPSNDNYSETPYGQR